MTAGRYAFDYTEDGVYGRAVALVREHGRRDGVHLDLGCGHGAVAEPLRETGLTYVGVDRDGASLDALGGRGFQTVAVDLEDVAGALSSIDRALAGRPLASVSLLDTLEHLTSGPDLLAVLHGLAHPAGAPLVVSVPNVAHRDVGLKLLLGRFDYTDTGLLDRTHLVHYTAGLLEERMLAAGWREVEARDLRLERSDQCFPDDLATLAPASMLHRFLQDLRGTSAPHVDTNQFIRAYLPGAVRAPAPPSDAGPAPFLSVVVRTQGRRPETLRDAFLCLLGQTDHDFEVVVAVHRASAAEQQVVLSAVAELPPGIRTRLRLVEVEGGGRARPLNEAFSAARGRYVAVLDDDDLVFAHWVATFHAAADDAPGSVLRTVCVDQEIAPAVWDGSRSGLRATGAMELPYPDTFDLLDHMARNHTPFMAYAFPRSLHRDLGLRFDETLDICEDWDFELRAALVAGVTSVPEVTAVYRRWSQGSSSASLHTAEEWRRTEKAILAKIDASPHVFPAGSIAAILDAVRREHRRAQRDLEALIERNHELEEHALRMERSQSWRLTAPLRALRMRRGPRP